MTIKAGDWQTLWDRMGDDAPCDEWQVYIETFPNVSTMLDAARKREVRNEVEPGQGGWWVRPRFTGTCDQGCCSYANADAETFQDFIWGMVGPDTLVSVPTNDEVIAVLRERYEDER